MPVEGLSNRIRTAAEDLQEQIVSYRRHLHQWPELSFQEEKTAAYISDILNSLDVIHVRNIGGHGIVAVIRGDLPGDTITALRADFDALPIQEENQTSYRSQNDGVMHACGHDVHTASLLGAISIIMGLKSEFGGTVKCLFQPAEERLPGGASLMIRDGALENPTPASIFGQHVHPPLGVGKVGVKGGMYMASADELFLTVKGKGGHAALPQDIVDPVLITANILVTLQQIISRKANPTTPSVLSFGKIQSDGGATNVIPSSVNVQGTFRTMDEEWRSQAHHHIRQVCTSVAEAGGGICDLEIRKGYPFLTNDENLTHRFRQYAIDFLGEDNVVDLPVRMTAEDFAYYSQEMPACFYRLGTGNVDKGITSPIHTPTFDVDEDCLVVGMGLLAYTALSELRR